MFWFIVATLIGPLGFILYTILWPEKEKCDFKEQNDFLVFLIKVIYKRFRYTPGELTIGSNLVYRAGGAGADVKCSLRILPTNHKTVVTRIRFDKDHLRRYKNLCGYSTNDSQVPICYPETLFFRQLSAVLSSKKFCLSPIGMIHLRQTIQQHELLDEYINADLTGTTTVTEYRQTDRGVEVDIHLALTSANKTCIWEGTVTLLSRKKTLTSRETRRFKDGEDEDNYRTIRDIFVPESTGIEYAKVSGDWNPIHLYKITAWPMGFKAPIAHGMWTLPRAMAVPGAFDDFVGDSSGRYSIDCSFKRPLFMPGTMTVKTNNSYEKCCIKVEDKASGVPHLIAKIVNLKQ